MVLGFTRHGLTPSRSSIRLVNMTIWTMIVITAIVLLTMFDSYFLHRPEAKSLISPLQRHDIQNCAMTYSYPTFIEINQPKPNSTLSDKYKLYLYRDGYLDNKRLYGVPALFIPGQAGSHKQIRSLASTTTTIYHQRNGQQDRNIDFFTVDLNEELSALSGSTLLDQAKYMNAAIQRILNLYNDPQPTSVMIVGHSMGGIVARCMFMQSNYIPNSIHTIITIATPHLTAPLLLDPVIYKTYKDMTIYWNQHQNTLLRDVTLISIAGGSLDTIIHSDGVHIDIPESHGLTTYTTSIPHVWTGSDHMAILWCHQFIQLLSSTLLQVVNLKTNEERMHAFRFHLLEGGKGSTIQKQNQLSDISSIRHVVLPQSSCHINFNYNTTTTTVTLMHATQKMQFLTNLESQHDLRWSMVLCKGSVNLSCTYVKPKVTVLPSFTAENLIGSNPFRLLSVATDQNYDYIGLIEHGGPSITDDDQVFLIGHTIADQPLVHTSSLWDLVWKGTQFHVDSYNSVHTFPFIRNSLFAYDVKTSSLLPQRNALFNPMMQQSIHDGKELKYYRGLESGVSDRITFHHQEAAGGGLTLRFFLDGQSLDMEIKIDWYGTLGRCVLRYGSILVVFLWLISLTVLLTQLYSYVLNGKREFIPFPVAIYHCLKGPILQLAALLLIGSIVQCVILNHWPCKHYPLVHTMASKYILLGSGEWIMTGLLLFAFALATGLTCVVWLIVSVIVFIISVPLSIFPRIQGSLNKKASLRQFLVHLTVAVGLLGFVPSSFIFTLYFILCLFLTASSRISAKSDLPSFQNIYNYRLSWLIFFTSLLPYFIPSVIVYIKELLIGWTHHTISLITLLQDLPWILILICLMSLGKRPDTLDAKLLQPVIYILNGIIIYQALFGFLHPFLISPYF